jgi:hypothetical protein
MEEKNAVTQETFQKKREQQDKQKMKGNREKKMKEFEDGTNIEVGF